MPVSSLIIRTNKDKTADVVKDLEKIKEATVSEVINENIVLITETNKQSSDKDLWKDIESIEGIVTCDLIYHNFEDEEDLYHDK